MPYTSSNLVALASMEWMQDNGFDSQSIQHQAEISKSNIKSWISSLRTAGMKLDDYVAYIANILGL